MINRAYKFRIYPNLNQQRQFRLEFAACRKVYNYYLEYASNLYKNEKKSSNFYDWNKDLTQLKKSEEFLWLNKACRQTITDSLRNLDAAYKNFFRNVKKGVKAGYPNFKKFQRSAKYSNICCKYNSLTHKTWFSKVGWIKTKDYKTAFGKLMNITVSEAKDGKWYVSICVEDRDLGFENESQSVIGIDMGVKDFLVDSDGNKIANPKFLEKSQRRIRRLQRELSRRKIGSNNRAKTRIKLAKMHEKITSQRKDFIHQISTELTKTNKTIAIETLSIKNMVKNHRLAKSIMDASWGEFFRQLKYKAEWYKSKIIEIGRFEPTSKTCHCCGYINQDLQLKDRSWVCPQCGINHDRDINAAKNILNLALVAV